MTQPVNLSAGADRAFPSHPRLDRYFPSSSAEDARTRLMSCVERGEGPAVLIGASGAGKTMLLEVLADAFANRFTIAHLASTQLCTRRALLQAVLHALGQPHRDREEGDLRLALVDHLQDTTMCPAGALLLVDEAQSLAPRLLEELRVLGNLARKGQPLVRMVLAGSTQLEECLASPELETLNQRVAARCYLAPLSYDELSQYVRAHIAATGANPDELLGADAAAAVFEATDGIPRLINQLCDRAIVLAVEAGAQLIDRNAIQNAWSDLHQLPAPWHTPEPASAVEAEPAMVAFETAATLETTVAPVAENEAPQPLWNADAALAEVVATSVDEAAPAIEAPVAEDIAPVEAPTPLASESAAVDPFGEEFEEEETLLDRFVADDSPFPAGTPLVTNQEDAELSSMVATLAPPIVDDAISEEPASDDLSVDFEAVPHEPADEFVPPSEPEMVGLPFPVEPNDATETELDESDEEPVGAVAALDIDSDPAVLLIEEDAEPAAISMVRRQEYRQLFASLRGG